MDPCPSARAARPESFFEFDTKTGEILAKRGLTSAQRHRAESTIKDLRLNANYHCRARARWLEVVARLLDVEDDAKREERALFVASRSTRFSSITRAWLKENGYSFAA